MKKIIMILMMLGVLLTFSTTNAADVELKITVPDAWVAVATAAINSKWPKPTGITQKKWAETQIRIWLRNIVGAYKRTLDRSAALDAGGYIETRDDDIPIGISP